MTRPAHAAALVRENICKITESKKSRLLCCLTQADSDGDLAAGEGKFASSAGIEM